MHPAEGDGVDASSIQRQTKKGHSDAIAVEGKDEQCRM